MAPLSRAEAEALYEKILNEVERGDRILLAGKTLLVLDTATGDEAENLYLSLGWTRVGVIPLYSLYPDGTSCDTTIFWKRLQ